MFRNLFGESPSYRKRVWILRAVTTAVVSGGIGGAISGALGFSGYPPSVAAAVSCAVLGSASIFVLLLVVDGVAAGYRDVLYWLAEGREVDEQDARLKSYVKQLDEQIAAQRAQPEQEKSKQ